MSLKSIDMSIAVHKSSDAGQVQRELAQKPIADQSALAQSSLKTADTTRQRPAKLDETDKSLIRNRNQEKNSSGGKRKKGTAGQQDGMETATNVSADPGHPFKGHHIDLSL